MKNILHLDNSEVSLTLLGNMFREFGFVHNSVKSIKDAFKLLENVDIKIDLIITAMELIDGKGDAFIRELNKSSFKSIPVVVITSDNGVENRLKMFSLGVVDYFIKNSSREHILSFISKLNEENESQKQFLKMKIAVIDDSFVVLKIIEKIFKLNNITNYTMFSDPLELLDCKESFNIYLCDIALPNYSGIELMQQLKTKNKKSGIIALSAIENEKVISYVLSTVADDYIVKPFETIIFLARLKSMSRQIYLSDLLEKQNKKLKIMSISDTMTGLFNHNHLIERLEQEVGKARRYKRPLSLCMFDLDDFKKVNDTYGHQTGDEVIIAFAEILKESSRTVDILGRYGGEEFIALLPETDLAGGVIFAERVREKTEETILSDNNLKFTVSVGVANYDGGTTEEFLAQADTLLYDAKKSGKNKVSIKNC